jgi:hypothetical protein
MDPAPTFLIDDVPQPTLLLAAVLKLLSANKAVGCEHLRSAIVHHLELIAEHPDDTLDPLLRKVCLRLASDWRSHLYGAMRH